jgi:hypothetical protein
MLAAGIFYIFSVFARTGILKPSHLKKQNKASHFNSLQIKKWDFYFQKCQKNVT